MIAFHGHSEPAPEGDANQDAFVVSPTRDGGLLLLVCDGMGGMGRGAEASRLATQHLERRLGGGADPFSLKQALVDTDMDLRRDLVDPGPGRPGCTAVAILVRDNVATVGWAGDARGVHVRGDSVVNHTVDHKLIEELIAAGTVSREEAAGGRMSHVVTRCLGGRRSSDEAPAPEVAEQPWFLAPGDALILCSDGLTDVVAESEFPALIAGCDVHEAVAALVRAAQARDTTDDTTVVVYRHPVQASNVADPGESTTSTRRGDPLLNLRSPLPDPRASRPVTHPGGPVDEAQGNTLALSWYFLAGAVACVVISAGLVAAWLGGLL